MAGDRKPQRRPQDEVAAAQAFYAAIGQDVSYFPALWHTFNVGHMLATDLGRICRTFELSLADFNLMGALRIERHQRLRATDLAKTLQVSSGALTARVTKLAERALLTKQPSPGDRRAFTLELTAKGARLVEDIHSLVAQQSHFVRALRHLSGHDRDALGRIMGELHSELDRHFVHVHR